MNAHGTAAGALDIAGAINFRDVGGLPAAGGSTRGGVLFRSGNLARLAPAGIDAVRSLGLRRIIDLRADDEVEHEPTPAGLAATTQRTPLFLGSVASFFTEDVPLHEMYRRLVDDAADRVVDVVRGIVEEQPVLVHCTVGKDRTGVTVALALAAAGVDEEAVIADYARTESLLPARRNARVVEILSAMHPRARNIEELATRSPAPVMRGLLDDLRARFGSPRGYLLAHGLADDEVDELARTLILR